MVSNDMGTGDEMLEEQDAWEEVIVASPTSSKKEARSTVKISRADKIEEMSEVLSDAMDAVYQGRFDILRAERMAALALSMQMELAKFLADSEWRAKQAKQELKYVSAEAHSKYKSMPSEKKLTDNALEQLVNKDKNVRDVDAKVAELECEFKKWQYVHGTLRDGHIFFRNLGKNSI